MAHYPYGSWEPLPQNATQRKITPISIALHTTGGGHGSPRSYFATKSAAGVEAHFWLDIDGGVHQFMDTTVRADCQLDGNDYAISIESADNGGPTAGLDGYNAKQLAGLVRLLTWLCKTHGIPAVKVQSYNGRGIGYHRQFTTPASSNAPTWNHSHACPGDRKIAQVPAIIAATKKALAGTTPAPAPPKGGSNTITLEGDDMTVSVTGKVVFAPTALALGPKRKQIPLVDKDTPSIINESVTKAGAIFCEKAAANVRVSGLTGNGQVFADWVIYDDNGKRVGSVPGTFTEAAATKGVTLCKPDWSFTVGKNRRLRLEMYTDQAAGVVVKQVNTVVNYRKA